MLAESMHPSQILHYATDGYFCTSDGLRLHYRHWSCRHSAKRGTVLILSGRAEFIDKYQETIKELDARGFDTIGLDWQGQGKSDRVLSDPNKGYVQRFQLIMSQVAAEPRFNVGCLTYGWLAAAFRSMDLFSNAANQDMPDLPVMITMAGRDRVVNNRAIVQVANRLPDCVQVTIEDARHEVLQERDELRLHFWRAFDAFTAQVST